MFKRGSESHSGWGGAGGIADRKTSIGLGKLNGDKEKQEMYQQLDRCVYEINPGKNDVKKFYQWTSIDDLSLKVREALKGVEKFEFDVFNLRTKSNGNELVATINYLMEINNFYTKLNITKEKFVKYSITIQNLYNPIPYHNKTHAALSLIHI